MCSLVFLCWASSLQRRWLGENRLCLLQLTSKSASIRTGKILREPADWLPIMHCCFLDRTIFWEIQNAVDMENKQAPVILSFTRIGKGLGFVVSFSFLVLPSLKQNFTLYSKIKKILCSGICVLNSDKNKCLHPFLITGYMERVQTRTMHCIIHHAKSCSFRKAERTPIFKTSIMYGNSIKTAATNCT